MNSIDNKEKISFLKNRYRPEIDGLRAFAVVAVIINHFNKDILPGGYLGVDIFFVISGFVMTSSLYQRPSKNFKDFIIGFYERRIKRLIPALSVFVLVTSIVICLFDQDPDFSLKTGLTSLFGLSNLYLLKQSTDYFAQSTELNVFTHTWSLGVEEQFYILFPFLIWFSGFGRQTKNGVRNLFLIVSALMITSIISFINLYQTNQPSAYFLMPSRFWEMAVGCMIFLGFKKRTCIEKFLEKIPPLLVILLIIGIMFLKNSSGAASNITVVTLSAVLIACLKKRTLSYTFFTNPIVVYIGLISYSLYLWHWGVISISRWTIGIHWWSIPFQIILMFSLAIASYRYLETPIRKNNIFKKRWKTILFGGTVIVTLSGGLVALIKPLNSQLYIGKRSFNTDLYQTLLAGEECLENNSNDTKCNLINNRSKKTLWMLGDSHTMALHLAGEQLANSLDMNLKLYGVSGMIFPPVYHNTKINSTIIDRFDDQRFVEKELYSQIKDGDVILLSIRLPYFFGGTPLEDVKFYREDGSFLSREIFFDEWVVSVINLSKIAQKYSAKVILQTPTPEWEKEENKFCSTINKQWFNFSGEDNCQIKSEFFVDKEKGIYKNLLKKLNQLATSNENIYLFDTYNVLCPKIICNFSKKDVDLYDDKMHISTKWARDFISPEIYKFIKTILDK